MADFFHNTIQPNFVGPQTNNLPSLATFVLNQAADAIEWVFQAESADAITHLLFSVNAVASAPSTTVQLCAVDASGRADTATVHASTTFTPVVGINAVALSYTPTRGQLLSVKVSGAGYGASNTATFNTRLTGNMEGAYYVTHVENGVATKMSSSFPVFGYRTASATYLTPIKAVATNSYSSTTQRGLKFHPPAGWGDTYQIGAVLLGGRTPAAASSYIVAVYSSSAGGASSVQSHTRDTDATVAAQSGHCQRIVFPSPLQTFSCGSPAYISLEPQGGATANYLIVLEFETSGDAGAMGGGGVFTYIERASSAAAWTESNTKVPLIAVQLADLTEPAGGGGGGNTYSRGRVVNG